MLDPGLTLGIEVLPPSDTGPAVSASAKWAVATARRLRVDGRIPEGMTKADLARLLAAEAETAAQGGQLKRALKASYIENQLKAWGLFPLK
jgi:hypothetical protein